jgi:tetratricopeptide (TPR) repeat protein
MPTENSLNSSHLEQHLTEARTRAEKGEYAAAVKAVQEAKSLAPKNVYVLAFEKQAEQLSTLDAARNLTEEQRTDILESIPSIIERALESSLSPGAPAGIPALISGGDATKEKKEKAAALEWLKNQYFQHAHEYIRKGEYQHALSEIRRVYIIDPANSIAQEFEKQFEALDKLKRGDSFRMYSPASAPAPQSSPEAVTPRPQSGPPPGLAVPPPVTTGESLPPQQVKHEPVHPPRVPEKREEKKKGSAPLIVLILLALAVLGAVMYIYYQRNQNKNRPVTTLPPPSSEQFIGAPAEAAEQNFIVSNDDSRLGTPQVTALAANAAPPPAAKEREKKSPGPSNAAQARENASGPLTPPVTRQDTPESSPPVMATQAQPGGKEPALQPKTEDTATPAPFVAIEKQARIIRLEKPKFSTQRFLVGVGGQVVIQVRIDATGKPVQTVTLKSTNDMLIQPVIEAVMASQYAPAEMTTGPIASWLTIPFRFASR